MNEFNSPENKPEKAGPYSVQTESGEQMCSFWTGEHWLEETTSPQAAYLQPVAANQEKAWR